MLIRKRPRRCPSRGRLLEGASAPAGGSKLASAVTDANGQFRLQYRKDEFVAVTHGPRELELVVEDVVGREVYRSEPFKDSALDDISIPRGTATAFIKDIEARGFLVTLGTGEPGPQSDGEWGLTQGASVKFLIDDEQFKMAAAMFAGAHYR